MESQSWWLAVGVIVAVLLFALLLAWRRRRTSAASARSVTLNYLIPGEDDEPLTPREVFVAGINQVGMCGVHRQNLVAKLRKGESIHLIRMPDNPHDSNAVALFTANGKDIGYLPRETAAEIAPRLDQGSPVTATVAYVEPFETEKGGTLLGARLTIVPHKLRRKLGR